MSVCLALNLPARWSLHGAGTLGNGRFRVPVPTLVSVQGAGKVACRYPGSPPGCLPGICRPLPSRSKRGCPRGAPGAAQALVLREQLSLLFPQTMPGAPEGGERSAGSRSPGRALTEREDLPPFLGPRLPPSPVRSGTQAPGRYPEGAEVGPSVHLWGCWPPPAHSWPLRLPRVPGGCKEHPEAPGEQDGGQWEADFSPGTQRRL